MALTNKTTQDFVPIKDVRDGVVILKDGSMRGVIMSTSLNFGLKSADEQASILFQFQNFLNALDFPIQMFVQSRRLDIRPYIALLQDQEKHQVNELLKIQIREYVKFIRNFTEEVNIMQKRFFVVIPYSPATKKSSESGLGSLFSNRTASEESTHSDEVFQENRTQLEQRVAVVEQGLTRCGLRGVQLRSEEVIELFYKIFNPDDTSRPMPLN
jgi:type IV secretory pathway VirB4 component